MVPPLQHRAHVMPSRTRRAPERSSMTTEDAAAAGAEEAEVAAVGVDAGAA